MKIYLGLLSKYKVVATSGFSLVELLVVVAIIGLLSAIALPTFLNQANRARQVEAQTYTQELLKYQAIHYQDNLEYTTDISNLGLSLDFERINSNPDRNFTYTLSSANTSSSVIIAAVPAKEALAGIAAKVTPNDNFTCSLDQQVPEQRGAAATQQLLTALPAATSCPPPSRVIN